MQKSTEVLVIGGGVTGCGVLFDLAQRGFKCLLVERGALSMGTSGRFHGLLHSGGRYVTNDPHAASECIQENRILRQIMPHAIEDTSGFFVTTPWDPPDYADTFQRACGQVDIPCQEISIGQMLHREPLLNPDISRCFEVPDGSIETWEACQSLVDSAQAYGAETLLFHKISEIIVQQGQVTGAIAENVMTGELVTIACDMVVNACGAWGGQIAHLTGCDVTVYPGKGTMLAMNYRLTNTVINRCLPPDDGDILVPVGTVAVIGTTSVKVDNPDCYTIDDWEIKLMLDEGEKLVPSFKQFRALRAWAGVRPLYQDKGASDDLRDVTRAFTLLDHAPRDGVENIVTITGGKWMTYRMMAENTVDLVCQKLGTHRPCQTATTPLLSRHPRRYQQLGSRLAHLETDQRQSSAQIICECELVTRPQIEASLKQRNPQLITDLRRDLRVGMGPCQGGFCTYRTACIMHEQKHLSVETANKTLVDFLQERWKGMTPVLWGQHLRQMRLDEGIYKGLLGLDKLPPELSGATTARLGELETEGYYEVGDGEIGDEEIGD